MPQMAPLMWLNLYILFILCFLFFNILNYYNFKYTNNLMLKDNLNTLKKNYFNFLWKW